MKKSKDILMVGPFPEPTTGVSLANKVVHEIVENHPAYAVKHINTSYTRFDEHIGKFSFHKLFFNLSFYTKAFRVFSSDIVYITPGQTFFGVAKYLGFYVLAALSRKHIITHVHGNHLGNEYAQLKGIKKKLFYRLLSKTGTGIVLSESLKANMTPFVSEDKVKVLPNFAQNYVFQPKPFKDYSELRIFYLSNLMQEKGIFELLGALKMMEDRGIAYKAKIAGAIDHSQKSEIEGLLKSLKNTTYVGVVRGEEKRALLCWGNVFVLPTYYKMEGQPISILEAMATANLIITTGHAGIPDIISDGKQGFFVKKKDTEGLYKQLAKLAEQKEDIASIGQNNESYFQENFTKAQFEKSLIDILDNA